MHACSSCLKAEISIHKVFEYELTPVPSARGGLGEKSGPGVTVRPAHSVHGALPTQYTARCPFNASHVSTSQWPTWKNTHTLNIILDDYKEITSYMFFFL